MENCESAKNDKKSVNSLKINVIRIQLNLYVQLIHVN